MVADGQCIELRSLKRYLQSYRNDGIYFEDATNNILDHIVACCKPRWIQVQARWNVRGGIETTITAQHGDPPVLPAKPD